MRFEGGGGEDDEFWWGGGGFVGRGGVFVGVRVLAVVLVLGFVEFESGEDGAGLVLCDGAVGDVVLGCDAEEDGARVTDAGGEEGDIGELAFVNGCFGVRG